MAVVAAAGMAVDIMVAGMAAVVIGTAAAGIMVVTVGVGELDPRSVSVLALDYSGER
jgi:hypothetical protein